MRNVLLVILAGSSALSLTVALAQSPQTNPANSPPPIGAGATTATLADCDRLVTLLEHQKPANAGITVEQVRTYKTGNNAQACHDALVRIDPAAAQNKQEGATNIVVQQPAPAVRVEQAAPQVTVQQTQPQVTVRQPQPEITVKQPAPTVTVDIPQPEIVVKMPRPEVNVAMVQPQVQVNQPPPQVQVTQQQPPQVEVQPAEPRVTVQQPGTQSNVQVQESDTPPTVHYERAEPRVVINQAPGQPNVRIEKADETQARGEPRREAAAPLAAAPGAASRQSISVAQLKKMNLYDARGNRLGDVEQVLQAQEGGKRHFVIGIGGFLGIGERHVVIPAENVVMRGNRLIVEGLTNDQIKTMPVFDRNNRGFREMEANATVDISSS
jgi:sporulation protein YlmC with PRC-barrel domain